MQTASTLDGPGTPWLHDLEERERRPWMPCTFGPLLVVAAAAVGCVYAWWLAGRLYSAHSALPLDPARLILRVVLLAMGQCCVGAGLVWLICRGRGIACSRYAWYLLLGHGAVPSLLWAADRSGSRAAGWCLAGVLAGLGLWRAVARALDVCRAFTLPAEHRVAARPRDDDVCVPSRVPAVLVPIVLLLAVAGSAVLRQDKIVYLRRDRDGWVGTVPWDQLSHGAFALEWTRQSPYRYFWAGFLPESLGLQYHYLSDVQISAWWSLCGGSHLDIMHRERFVLVGLAIACGLYVLARSFTGSRAWGLAAVIALSALPYPALGLDALTSDGLQRAWSSFTVGNGVALGAAFLASSWAWLSRGEKSLGAVALAFVPPLVLAKVNFAMLALPAVAMVVVWCRPRQWLLWLSMLGLLAAAAAATEPRGADVLAAAPRWAPGYFWRVLWANSRAREAGEAAREVPGGPRGSVKDGQRGMKSLQDLSGGVAVGVLVLVVGAAGAWLSAPRPIDWSSSATALAVLVLTTWGIFLVYVSLFWFLTPHETGGQFLPWLSLLSFLAGLAGCRFAYVRWQAHAGRAATPRGVPIPAHRLASRALPIGLGACLVLLTCTAWVRAYEVTQGFARPLGHTPRPVHFSLDCWNTIEYLRSRTPLAARVLSPFGLLGAAPHGMHAISGWAGRRAVDEHVYLARFYAGLDERVLERQQMINGFYADPTPERLAAMAGPWGIDYVVLASDQVGAIPVSMARPVFRTREWSVLEWERPLGARVPGD